MSDLAYTDTEVWNSFKEYSKTFSAATKLLPKDVRLPVATLYAFCRRVDDIADKPGNAADPSEALRELDYFEDSIRAIISENKIPQGDLLWPRIYAINQEWHLSIIPFLELIEGARFDLRRNTIETQEDLIFYSNLVAGSIGAMMLPFLTTGGLAIWDQIDFEQWCQSLDQPSRDLGIAMQITNILRDVGEDYQLLNRVYIPQQLLDSHDIKIADLFQNRIPKAYPILIEELMATAEKRYITGLGSIKDLDRKVRPGIRSAAKMYREILNEIRKNQYDNLSQRAFTKKSTKLRLSIFDTYERTRNRYRLTNA